MVAPPAPANWWDDWLKFTPGWVALAVTLFAGGRRWWVRRGKLAEGPEAEAAREQLKEMRAVFELVVAQGGRESHLLQTGAGREAAREIREHAERRRDKRLRRDMLKVADVLDEVIRSAPHELGEWAGWGDADTPEQQAEWDMYQRQREKQVEDARKGIEHATSAIARFNKLERRTHGR